MLAMQAVKPYLRPVTKSHQRSPTDPLASLSKRQWREAKKELERSFRRAMTQTGRRPDFPLSLLLRVHFEKQENPQISWEQLAERFCPCRSWDTPATRTRGRPPKGDPGPLVAVTEKKEHGPECARALVQAYSRFKHQLKAIPGPPARGVLSESATHKRLERAKLRRQG